jgi:hypothetical protein
VPHIRFRIFSVKGSFLSAARVADVEKEAWYLHTEQRYGDGVCEATLTFKRPIDLPNLVVRRMLEVRMLIVNSSWGVQ